jgi:multicomponent Na+:H+ antiporter subunit B
MTFNWREIIYVCFILVLVGMVGLVLFMTVFEMPDYGDVTNPTNNYVMRRYVDMSVEESGGYNFVTNIILDYRGYDTLLETTVIFTAVMSIIVLWGVQGSKE